MKWALLSVWDKTGIVDLARALIDKKYSLMSSGGTGKALAQAGIKYTEVSSYTGFPEMMDGRVKTLHPKVHGGLLGRRQIDDAIMARYGIDRIDLLVVNLYPFEAMSKQQMDLEKLIEFIDVGGPAMIRAAAKNYKDVTVVVDPNDYPLIMNLIQKDNIPAEQRLDLAKKAFARTAAYDAAISNYLYNLSNPFPTTFSVQYTNGRALRYGENPHHLQRFTVWAAWQARNPSRASRCLIIITWMSIPVLHSSVNSKSPRQFLSNITIPAGWQSDRTSLMLILLHVK